MGLIELTQLRDQGGYQLAEFLEKETHLQPDETKCFRLRNLFSCLFWLVVIVVGASPYSCQDAISSHLKRNNHMHSEHLWAIQSHQLPNRNVCAMGGSWNIQILTNPDVTKFFFNGRWYVATASIALTFCYSS